MVKIKASRSQRDCDVAVIGAGAAGLACAIAAADAGASVVVLEACGQVGGSSRLSGGHVFAAGTSVQRASGIEDDADAMFEHYMTLNQWMVEPSVVRRYCDASGATVEWLRELGIEFDGVYVSGVGDVARGHLTRGEGHEVISTLDRHCSQRGVEIVFGARVSELLRDDDGHVTGVRANGDELHAGAVVVATGGFGANPELLAKHYPDAAAPGDWTWYIGSPDARGDGIMLGEGVGAALDGHNRGLLLATPGFSHDLEVFLPGWLVLVDRTGRRFASETAPYSMLGGLIQRHGGVVWAVFDEAARAAAEPTPMQRAYWVGDILKAQADAGGIHREESLAALALSAGIDGEALAGTLERYNADCEFGRDDAFFKPPAAGTRPIVDPPFYAVPVRPAILAWTGAGLRIDADMRVIGRDERSIPGLFAAGETVGSLHGDRYVGGGGSFGPCLAFGKIAGENAAALARGAS
jgi:fumarate reductase flavoprotein subunit